jgi:uncharacterized protein (TIGR02001 family)
MTKKLKTLTAVLAGVAALASSAIAQEAVVMVEEEVAPVSLSVGVDLASAYVFRGVTFNDGMVAQPWMDATTSFGLNFGVWANFDIGDYDGTLEKNEFSEIDIYVGWGTTVADMIDLGVGYCEYTYPMSDNEADREISISAGIPFVGVAAYFGVDGGIKDTIYLEATAEYGIDITEELSAGISASAAYLIDDNDGGESGFANYTAGVSLGYGIFGASVTYIGQGDDKVLPEEQGGYDVEVVGMLSIGYTF